MGRNKIGLQFKGFEEYMEKLDEVGGSSTMKRGTENALKASKQYVNPLIDAAMVKGNLPAHGKYSTGGTKASIDKDMQTEWEGMTAATKIGFVFAKSGLKSIFLMYGTPKMSPVAGLKDAIYGNKTKKQIAKIQEETLTKTIQRIMGG